MIGKSAAMVAALASAACAPRALPGGVPATVTATYRCADGRTLAVRFDNRADTAEVALGDRQLLLRGQRPASGIWYADSGYELRGKGDDARVAETGGHSTECTAAVVR